MMPFHPGMPPEYRNRVTTGDAHDLARAIPDGSVEMVFTDPLYERMGDYLWLAEQARRVLRPGGAFLCFCGIGYLEQTMAALRLGGTPVKWTCGVYLGGSNKRAFPQMFSKWTCLLWCLGEPNQTILDMPFAPLSELTGPHPWKKPITALRRFVEAFSLPGETVWDPFCGGATVAAACRMVGRNFVAFEVDAETAAIGRERVRLTPEPLLVLDDLPPQTALDFAPAPPRAPHTSVEEPADV